MTSSERTDSQTTAVSAAETSVCQDGCEASELRREIEALKLKLAQAADQQTEIEALKLERAEAREQQTATSEILRLISQSQRDVQPVFEAIATNARKLCRATQGAVLTFDGELIHHSHTDTLDAEGLEAVRRDFPTRPTR